MEYTAQTGRCGLTDLAKNANTARPKPSVREEPASKGDTPRDPPLTTPPTFTLATIYSDHPDTATTRTQRARPGPSATPEKTTRSPIRSVPSQPPDVRDPTSPRPCSASNLTRLILQLRYVSIPEHAALCSPELPARGLQRTRRRGLRRESAATRSTVSQLAREEKLDSIG